MTMKTNRRTFLKQVGLGAAGAGLVSLGWGRRGLAVAPTSSRLARATPESQGVASSGILAFLDAAAASRHEFHSFMVVRHGRVVAEGWWTPYGPQYIHGLYSLSKSFTSTAVGLAVSEGRLHVDDRVVSFFPHELPARVSPNLAALRVKHLLTMSVGDRWEPTWGMVKRHDWVKYFLAAPITHKPGSVFLYNSSASFMLSAIVQKVTGQKVIDYLRPRLFEPLGISGETWEVSPRGINCGGWGLSVRTEALAKFGQMYLQKGAWRGRQILPAKWVRAATTKEIQQPLPAHPRWPNSLNDSLQGYGYQFWCCTHNAFCGDGAFGQYDIVIPDQDAVVAITCETHDMQGELDLVWQHLLPAMKPAPLPANPRTVSRLRQRLASLALRMPKGKLASPLVGRISGKIYKLQANRLGLRSVSFQFARQTCRVTFTGGGVSYPIACGFGRWDRGETALPGTPVRLVSGGAPPRGTPSKIATAGAWPDEDTFVLMLRYYETPHHDTVTCRFDGDRVRISFMNSIAAMSLHPRDARPVLHGTVTT